MKKFITVRCTSFNEYMTFTYTAQTKEGLIRKVLDCGSLEEILGYDPEEALQKLETDLFCYSKYMDDFAYVRLIETEQALNEFLGEIFDDPGEALGEYEGRENELADLYDECNISFLTMREKTALRTAWRRECSAVYRYPLPKETDPGDIIDHAIHLIPGEPAFSEELTRHLRLFCMTETAGENLVDIIDLSGPDDFTHRRLMRTAPDVEHILNTVIRCYALSPERIHIVIRPFIRPQKTEGGKTDGIV